MEKLEALNNRYSNANYDNLYIRISNASKRYGRMKCIHPTMRDLIVCPRGLGTRKIFSANGICLLFNSKLDNIIGKQLKPS